MQPCQASGGPPEAPGGPFPSEVVTTEARIDAEVPPVSGAAGVVATTNDAELLTAAEGALSSGFLDPWRRKAAAAAADNVQGPMEGRGPLRKHLLRWGWPGAPDG